jgi:hypothetical protein
MGAPDPGGITGIDKKKPRWGRPPNGAKAFSHVGPLQRAKAINLARLSHAHCDFRTTVTQQKG